MVASVRYRYPDTEDLPGPLGPWWLLRYIYRPELDRPHILTVVEALKALAGYSYQSCERPDWYESEACRFVQRMTAWLLEALPGYDDAPWEIR